MTLASMAREASAHLIHLLSEAESARSMCNIDEPVQAQRLLISRHFRKENHTLSTKIILNPGPTRSVSPTHMVPFFMLFSSSTSRRRFVSMIKGSGCSCLPSMRSSSEDSVSDCWVEGASRPAINMTGPSWVRNSEG